LTKTAAADLAETPMKKRARVNSKSADLVSPDDTPAPVVAPMGTTKGKVAPKLAAPKLVAPGIGNLYLSLGSRKSEVCFVQGPGGHRTHLLTVEEAQTPYHRELAAELCRLATASDITVAELRAVKNDRLCLLAKR
jgi:hypothetical protein